jgi:Predicted nucleotidyltransferases
MKTLDEIKRILNSHKEELRERYKVKEIGIFGSFVRGEQKESSDLDILVEYETVPGLLKFLELEIYLEELLGTKVDLVRKQAIRSRLKDVILKEVVYL